MRFNNRRLYRAIHAQKTELGLTWNQVRDQMGYAPSHTSFYDRVKQLITRDLTPRVDTLLRYTRWLEANIEDFVDFVDDNKKKMEEEQ